MSGSAEPSAPAENAAFEALWAHVLEHWEDDKAHLAFLEHCQAYDQLLPAAKRYRELSHSAAHAAQATRRLNAISVLALAGMERARSGPAAAKRQAGRLVALIFLVAMATSLLIFYGLR
ncbi:MAG TPA: hypothetical protein VFU02_04980 [Polyangiaceae bacterium]|nr:hypothetical protein [Polyangiaceae bacterium]